MNPTAPRHHLLAIVRGTDADAALKTVLALADEDITTVEVSLTTPDALRVIERARQALGAHVLLGAGTVCTSDDAARAADAGAGFLVTPGLLDPLPELPVVMGALTPTEIIIARDRGARAVKLFPSCLGGPGYLTALRGPFPDVPFVPVGGIDLAAARAYIAAGALAVGVGTPLIGDAADGGDLDALRLRARTWHRALAGEVHR
ncbi:bifunctional 4-hydroxy-2-oxoglutarate aldolase/2-dehydro-3-deoxy-phosphogluconate aldolase [Streptomyces coffeae]|uniref:Bifunctional 4-hydroxy-2-oxoglutarate aldolase/2-dehydro-3-deoxy-phosphogluconate aldolase n=1 Tax=Streptomyces coffeae TaxID=621382 RepID=A0ABS1NPW3_9ACTN|nr:bifunctional 4-hydroxy-2-oxoglutarate aldolase/2-dehydro-3-deoxy-phosphogluconate aldolase [Streptomyces coffeae]MBL1102140.1 bifunctional 4-hydroxy-2-oxoglutarate aldolase/2-dehydro-3-deoxy-phosphogluconate aldolase [Streptomyces coffeae]